MIKKFFKKVFGSKKVEVFNFSDLRPAIVKNTSFAVLYNEDGSSELTYCEEVCRNYF